MVARRLVVGQQRQRRDLLLVQAERLLAGRQPLLRLRWQAASGGSGGELKVQYSPRPGSPRASRSSKNRSSAKASSRLRMASTAAAVGAYPASLAHRTASGAAR